MTRKLILTAKVLAGSLALILVTLLAMRIYDSQRGLPLEPWHTFIPTELSVAKLDTADWTEYLAHEAAIFNELRQEVTQKLSRRIVFPSTAISTAARSIRDALRRTSTAPSYWNPTVIRWAPSCCCTA